MTPLSVASFHAPTGAPADGPFSPSGSPAKTAAAHGARGGQGQENRRQLQHCDGQVGPGCRQQVWKQRSVIHEGEFNETIHRSPSYSGILGLS